MTATTTHRFQPVLLGTDINAYGMARSFHEEYGVVSWALGSFPLTPTRDSKIVQVSIDSEFASDDGFVRVLSELGRRERAADPNRSLLLVPCGDAYSALLSAHRETLAEWFDFVMIDDELLASLVDKASFYRLCEQHGLDHPVTRTYSRQQFVSGTPIELPSEFPIALKPADSVAYLDCQFPGRKKAYVLANRQQLDETVRRIFSAGYPGELILQDFVPGDDSQMRVLNAYVNRDGTVAMMSLGNPLLEDYAPASIGNYVAIVSESNDAVYAQAKRFLEAIGYVGFVNFDMKLDPRDGRYRFFELNPRQGRSSFFTTLAGLNLARWLVRDVVEQEYGETVYGREHALWVGVPRPILKRYAAEGQLKAEALQLIREGRWGSTVFYRRDLGLRRRLNMWKLWLSYYPDYRRNFGNRELDL
ncbi:MULTISPECIES: carboxylate--amine ligase [unclassified Pseudoclavibacter]|uniref:carboxylate--amine ligase n=1 Tax=unclassified Pseudoclavibacter TaxID=2615177 RepID=UPI0013013707|nr:MULTISPECIES: carboxylate--amine ligase [unclassified Pseudoclavibacter]KAB1659110.1 carboxylate--amine ligase [Pseudoclavibacter sp. CFCC 11306]KAB1660910.1 carboxylate--amine ligase [Pseudoclavibacter sp. CFCC 13796]